MASRLAAALLGCVVLFQVALVMGAPGGAWTQGGRVSGALDVPGRSLAALSALLLATLALAALGVAGTGPMRRAPRLARGLTWAGTAYSGLGVLLNAVSPSLPERALWTPVTAAVFVALFATLMTTGRTRRGDGQQ